MFNLLGILYANFNLLEPSNSRGGAKIQNIYNMMIW